MGIQRVIFFSPLCAVTRQISVRLFQRDGDRLARFQLVQIIGIAQGVIQFLGDLSLGLCRVRVERIREQGLQLVAEVFFPFGGGVPVVKQHGEIPAVRRRRDGR